MTKKYVILAVLVGLMTLGLFACGGNKSGDDALDGLPCCVPGGFQMGVCSGPC